MTPTPPTKTWSHKNEIRAALWAAVTSHRHEPSNTERGHKTDLANGEEIAVANGVTIRAGVDLHDVARGGAKTTKRNRLTTQRQGQDRRTYWPNEPASIEAILRVVFRRG